MTFKTPPSVSRFFASIGAIFAPPFEGLWVVMALYYVWSFLVYPHSQVLRGNFPDPDDYMYLVQVMDWMKGQGFYDNVQHRLNPPEGVMIHFSRLAMFPMAGLVWLFELCGWGIRGSSMLMAIIYPPILLCGFFIIMKRVAKLFMSPDWAGVTAYAAIFSTGLMYMFQPGHVDHHGLMIMVTALAMGFAVKAMQEPGRVFWGIAAGATLAIGMMLALEILPWVLIIAGWLGLWAVVKGKAEARHALAFALSLYLTSILCLLFTRPPEDFFLNDVLTYSVTYVFLTGGIAVCFAGVALTANRGFWLRAIVASSLALLTGFLFFQRFPDLIAGPYGAMDPELQATMLDDVNEAQPLTERFHSVFILLSYLSASLMALGATAWFMKKARPEDRWHWGLQFMLLLAAFLLTTFYQCRYAGTMGMLSLIPLAVMLQRSWQWVGAHYQGRKKIYTEIGLLVLIGPLFSVFLPALADGRHFNTGILLFPVTGTNTNYCDTYVLEQVLRDSITLGDRPRLIINDMGLGPELLYRTSHKVLAAPFFDTQGNMDAYRFFSTPYPQEAEAIARRRHIELVVSCMLIPVSFMRTSISQPNSEISRDFAPHFVESLIHGKAPDWLRRVEVPSLRNYVIYEVLPPKTGPDKPTETR